VTRFWFFKRSNLEIQIITHFFKILPITYSSFLLSYSNSNSCILLERTNYRCILRVFFSVIHTASHNLVCQFNFTHVSWIPKVDVEWCPSVQTFFQKNRVVLKLSIFCSYITRISKFSENSLKRRITFNGKIRRYLSNFNS
jgi:hypothetical protein